MPASLRYTAVDDGELRDERPACSTTQGLARPALFTCGWCRHATSEVTWHVVCLQVYGVLVGPAKPLPGTGGQVVRGTGNLAPLIVLPNDGINGTNYNVIITQSPGYWAP